MTTPGSQRAGLETIPEVDDAALFAWLQFIGIDIVGQIECTRVGHGQSNLTYLLADEGGAQWVLRRPPAGEILDSAHDVVREARIMNALADSAVAMPRIYGVCMDEAVSPVPLVLMEHVDAIVLDNMTAAESMSVTTRGQVSKSMVRELAKIHAVDLDAVKLSELASNRPYAQRQLKRWGRQWEISKTRDLPALNALTRRLSTNFPVQREVCLVHGDFHIRNVMVDQQTGDIRAVLDWELSTLGDPLADMGSMLAYWRASGEPFLGPAPVELLHGFPDREELAVAYTELTGRRGDELTYWHSFGLWKLAIIAEGIIRRTQSQPLNPSAPSTPTPAAVETLIDMAHAVADRTNS